MTDSYAPIVKRLAEMLDKANLKPGKPRFEVNSISSDDEDRFYDGILAELSYVLHAEKGTVTISQAICINRTPEQARPYVRQLEGKELEEQITRYSGVFCLLDILKDCSNLQELIFFTDEEGEQSIQALMVSWNPKQYNDDGLEILIFSNGNAVVAAQPEGVPLPNYAKYLADKRYDEAFVLILEWATGKSVTAALA